MLTCGGGHQHRPTCNMSRLVFCFSSQLEEAIKTVTYLVAGVDESVGNDYVLPPPRDKHHDLGNIIWRQWLTPASPWSAFH